MSLPKILVVLGPTATGKSDLGVKLAKKFDGLNRINDTVGRTSRSEVLGEMVSADSRQVYRGLDIGTGKITTEEMQGVPHHLLDVADPNDYFSVVRYKHLAEATIDDIIARGKLPILVGGTGLYIHAVTKNVTYPDVPPNIVLRKELRNKTTPELVAELEKLDPVYAQKIDRENPRRLVRAIEIARALGMVPAPNHGAPRYDPLLIGLTLPTEELRVRIDTRLHERLEKGMIEEAATLHAQGLSWERMEDLGLEYRYLARFLQNKLSREEMIQKLSTEIWRYAKRQSSWFKKNQSIHWFPPEEGGKVFNLVDAFLYYTSTTSAASSSSLPS